MRSDWITVELGQLGSFKNGANFNKNHYGSDHPVINVKNLFRGRFATTDGLDKLASNAIRRIEDYYVRKGDVLFARSSVKASGAGQVALVRDFDVGTIFSGFIIRFRANEDGRLNSKFLYYVLKSPEYRELLTRIATGTTISNLSQATLSKLPINLPSRSEQDEIVSILDQIDTKSEHNVQVNKTLENIAQAIFKSWFVDFEPVKAKIAALEAGCSDKDALIAAMQAISGKDADQLTTMQAQQPEQYAELLATAELFPSVMQDSELGEIPEGWSIGNVGKLANAKGGYAFKSKQFSNVGFPVLKIKNITGNGTVNLNDCQCIDSATASLANRFKLSDGDLVMAMTGATVGKTGLVVSSGEDIYLNQRVAKFESNKFGSEIGYFLFCLFKRKSTFDELVGAAQGSAQPNISSSGIEMVRLVVPKDELVIRFINTCRPIFNLWMNSERQNFELVKARDALLPKLLSGELEV